MSGHHRVAAVRCSYRLRECARVSEDVMIAEERQAETERARRLYDRIAPRYDHLVRWWEWLLFEGGREWACSRARGQVLEIGVGTGRNLPLYPPEVQVTGVDVSPGMLKLARDRRHG